MERHLDNARTVAEFLEADERVGEVTWASLPSSPYYATAQKYLPRGAGSVLGFVLPGGLEAGRRFVDALTLHSHVANIGDVRSLVIHPASTHSQLTEAEHRAAGIRPVSCACRWASAHRRHPRRHRARAGRRLRVRPGPGRPDAARAVRSVARPGTRAAGGPRGQCAPARAEESRGHSRARAATWIPGVIAGSNPRPAASLRWTPGHRLVPVRRRLRLRRAAGRHRGQWIRVQDAYLAMRREDGRRHPSGDHRPGRRVVVTAIGALVSRTQLGDGCWRPP